MYIPNLKWSAESVLEAVDESELVLVLESQYLGVWFGDYTVAVYDLTQPEAQGYVEFQVSSKEVYIVQLEIEEYVETLNGEIPEEDLTGGRTYVIL
jgi:hypothetical protein